MLPVLAASVGQDALTTEEAGWVVRLRVAVPDVPLGAVRLLARAYLSYKHQRLNTSSLDFVLAAAPWRSIEHAAAYGEAILSGAVAFPPGLVYGALVKEEWQMLGLDQAHLETTDERERRVLDLMQHVFRNPPPGPLADSLAAALAGETPPKPRARRKRAASKGEEA